MNEMQQTYADLQKAVIEKLTEINNLLLGHAMEFTLDPQYGYLGDMAHVDNLLGEVVAFLKNSD
jgi:hypothetical protein